MFIPLMLTCFWYDTCAPSPAPVPVPAPAPAPAPVPEPVYPNPPVANSFHSLHQNPITYVKSSWVDAQGQLNFSKTPPLTGFKDQFSPAGTPGCVIGYPEMRSECQTVNGGFGFNFEGVTSYMEYKIYVPAGMTFFGASGYLPQSEKYAVAVRIDQPPSRRTALSDAEYSQAKMAQHREYDFAKVLGGEERLIVHDGGGSISLSGIARMGANPLSKGRWIFIRVLNGSSIHGLGAIYEVQRDIYKTEYYKTSFGSNGDPH